MEAFILSEVEQGVMTITLNRPDRLNSFNDLMHQQLAACLKQAERDDSIRCLLVTGAGRGVAAGAGATLAMGCDIVLAARSAKFVMAFSKLGLVPDCGGSWFLPRVAGRARAMGLALLGDSLSAEQAAQWGMIWQVVDDAELKDTSLALARHLAAQPTYGLGLIKNALRLAETQTLDQQLDLERDYQRLAGRSADYREGVSAFLAKRPPHFSGK